MTVHSILFREFMSDTVSIFLMEVSVSMATPEIVVWTPGTLFPPTVYLVESWFPNR